MGLEPVGRGSWDHGALLIAIVLTVTNSFPLSTHSVLAMASRKDFPNVSVEILLKHKTLGHALRVFV